jgi:hypothetical protein
MDVTGAERKRLKALAAVKGVSLKDYLLDNASHFRKDDKKKSPDELGDFLDERLRNAHAGRISKRKAGDIFKQAAL